jgi:hypothetical protein
MAEDTTSPTGTPDAKPTTSPPVCHHSWETAAPYHARCITCGFVVPITTEEV